MALNLSMSYYCHSGNMCAVTVIYLNASNIITAAPSPPPFHPPSLYKHTHAYTHTHTSTLWCTYTHLAPSLSIGSIFRGTSSHSDRLDISRSNNLSQTLRVALVSPSAPRTRCLTEDFTVRPPQPQINTHRHTHTHHCSAPTPSPTHLVPQRYSSAVHLSLPDPTHWRRFFLISLMCICVIITMKMLGTVI